MIEIGRESGRISSIPYYGFGGSVYFLFIEGNTKGGEDDQNEDSKAACGLCRSGGSSVV